MLVSDLIALIDRVAPFDLAEPWDRVGLQAGSRRAPVERLLVTLDVTDQALDAAAAEGCQAILAHHPLVFEPLAAVTDDAWPGSAVARLLREGRSLVVAHTNLDKARGGLADVICDALGLEGRQPLEPQRVDWCKLVGFVPANDAEAVRTAVFAAGAGVIGGYVHCSFTSAGEGSFLGTEGTSPAIGRAGVEERTNELRVEVVMPRAARRAVIDAYVAAHPYEEPAFDVYAIENEVRSLGLGRVGFLAEPQPLDELARAVAGLFGLPAARFTGDPKRVVSRVACLPGSGASAIDAAAASAEVLITGDVKYHDAQHACRQGLSLIDVPHEASEGFAMERFARRLHDELAREAVELVFFAPPSPLWKRLPLEAGSETTNAERKTMHSNDDDRVHLYVDGGARGNPGPAGIGGQLLDPDGVVLDEFSDAIGTATNNEAEYEALITGLELALDRGVRVLTVFSDSELVIKQLRGEYKVKVAHLRPLFDRARTLLDSFQEITLKNVRREQNTEADRLVNEALDAAL